MKSDRSYFYRLNPFHWTKGEARAAGALGVAAFTGAFIGVIMVVKLAGENQFERLFDMGSVWLILASAVGGAFGFYLVRSMFGRDGVAGFAWATLGGFAMCLAGAVIGGTVALPGYGSMYGLIMLFNMVSTAPITLFVIWSAVLLIHVRFRDYVKERDTVLNYKRPMN